MELVKSASKIVLLSIDGVGGLEHPDTGKTELEQAKTPNLDRLAAESETGLITHVGTGITPGSGPGHLGLFGYDPLQYDIGRGILSALGIGYNPQPDEIFFRGNFAIQDEKGIITDRRAGRISTETNQSICKFLSDSISEIGEVKIKFLTEKEHRFVLVLKGSNLAEHVTSTDPQTEGKIKPTALATNDNSKNTAEVINQLTSQIEQALKGKDFGPNTVLLRGASPMPDIPTFKEKYKIDKSICIATYPMYKGLSRLVGMEIADSPDEEDMGHLAQTFSSTFDKYDFFFIHVKKADSYGEDGDFNKKAGVIEKVDAGLIPQILETLKSINDDNYVFAITGDHSSPAMMAAHSWHSVPLLIHSKYARRSRISGFSEHECARGNLGIFPAQNMFQLLLAHSKRIAKYGA